jgi:hypothetical protein
MMTVAELIESLKTLPQDMQIMMLDSERESPVDIVQVSRGSWGEQLEDDEDFDLDDMYNGEFIQDDENGKIAVLVTW